MGGLMQGIYVDDYLILATVRKECARDPAAAGDTEMQAKAREAYAKAQLPVSEKKCFSRELQFTAWGTEVNSTSGSVAAPVDRRKQILLLTFQVLGLRFVTGDIMASLLGAYVHPFMHRKCCMAVFGRAYRFLDSLDSRVAARLPADVADELLAASLLLCCASSNMRAEVSTQITCSDATPCTVGTVEAGVSRELADCLHDFGEYRGRYVRLDWTNDRYDLVGWEDPLLPAPLVKVLNSAPWKVRREEVFRCTRHVNIQEMVASLMVIDDRCKETLKSERLVNGTDSRVALGAIAKGRSSSRQLNRVLRHITARCILGRKHFCQFWVDTKSNPADDPSRGVALRKPERCPPDLKHLLLAQRSRRQNVGLGGKAPDGLCLECYAGCGRLSKALESVGFGVAEPMESFPSKGVYVARHDLDDPKIIDGLRDSIRRGVFLYVHFGIPCSSWSTLRFIGGGSRRANKPEGDLLDQKELRGNQQACVVAELCWLLHVHGGWFSVENPRGSLLWQYGPMRSLSEVAASVDFDQCCYGLRLVGCETKKFGPFIKKPTRLLTNVPALKKMSMLCKGDHQHHSCMGSVRVNGKSVSVAKAAGAYPPALCKRWSGLLLEAAQGSGGLPPRGRVELGCLTAPGPGGLD